jgi:hypothetical protein
MAKEPAGLRRWRLSHKKRSHKGVTMARTKLRKHGKKSFTLPLAIVAGAAPAVATTYNGFRAGGISGAGKELAGCMIGFDAYANTWNFGKTRWGLQPLLGGMLVHKLASMVGINKALASAGIPFIRI